MYKIITGGITAPKDFMAAGIHCGIRKDKRDLALIYSTAPCDAVGVFTTNKVKAAPVLLTKKFVSKGKARAVIINSGNANCCTGKRGEADALRMCQLTAEALDIDYRKVLVCSTGKIGEYLPLDKIENGIPKLVKKLSTNGYRDAAEAILTTDLVTKHVAVELAVGKKTVRIGAIAKGSGMIQPNMATMLAFIATDAVVNRPFMRRALRTAVDESFHRITVDGDMSTNDTVLLLANSVAGNAEITERKSGGKFLEALTFVCRTLARKIVEDGEGATKFVRVRVEKASSKAAARKAARAIANSPLFKTAMYGEDPNWGRIMSSVGSSGITIEQRKVGVFINGLQVVRSGARSAYDRKKALAVMRRKEITVRVDLASGRSAEEIWTCDLSHKYVDINI